MPSNRIERLHYYERQFLSADDFRDQQEYHRCMRQRHNLGPHTWGIVAGLELAEVTTEGGSVDAYVMPGLAVDGFGRSLVVLQPRRIDPVLFEPFRNQPKTHLAVWIAYSDQLTGRAMRGYSSCETEEPYGRVLETIEVIVEPREPYSEDLIVAGHAFEGATPRSDFESDEAAAQLIVPGDTSVPHQELPEVESRPRWLVRLGNVRWDGQKVIADDADPKRLLQDRRYVGSVAEHLVAPAGTLAIRDRRAPQPLPSDEADAFFGGVVASVEGSLDVQRGASVTGELTVTERVGIGTKEPKARLHIEGGSDAELTPESGYVLLGSTEGTHLALDDNELMARKGGDVSKLHLQANGGALEVHSKVAGTGVLVQEDGFVGIGTSGPEARLHLGNGADVKLDEGGTLVIGQTDGFNLAFDSNEIMARNGGGKSALHLQADGGDLRLHNNLGTTQKFVVKDSGDVGIGTGNPEARLHVEGGSDAEPTGGGFLVLGDVDGANMALDDNEIMARNDNGTATLHLQANGGDLHLHSKLGSDQQVIVKESGRLGLGTSAPSVPLQVAGGSEASLADGTGFFMLGSEGSANTVFDTNEVQARNNGATRDFVLQPLGGDLAIHSALPSSQRFIKKTDGDVGIGTSSPLAKLDVRGTVRHQGLVNGSDARWKKNVHELRDATGVVKQLRPVRFQWDSEKHPDQGFPDREQYGFIAQEVEKVIPELVSADRDGYLVMNVLDLVPTLVQCLKELSAEHAVLSKRVSQLESASKEPRRGRATARRAQKK